MMNQKILSKYSQKGYVWIFSCDSFTLSFPCCKMRLKISKSCTQVYIFTMLRKLWVTWCTHMLVVAFDMLIKEMRVKHQSKGNTSEELVNTFLAVNQLVASHACHSCQEASWGNETDEFHRGVRLRLENPMIRLIIGAEEHQVEDPSGSLGEHIEVKADLVWPITNVFLLIFLVDSDLIKQEVIIDRSASVCKPRDDHHISCINKDNLG